MARGNEGAEETGERNGRRGPGLQGSVSVSFCACAWDGHGNRGDFPLQSPRFARGRNKCLLGGLDIRMGVLPNQIQEGCTANDDENDSSVIAMMLRDAAGSGGSCPLESTCTRTSNDTCRDCSHLLSYGVHTGCIELCGTGFQRRRHHSVSMSPGILPRDDPAPKPSPRSIRLSTLITT